MKGMIRYELQNNPLSLDLIQANHYLTVVKLFM